MADVERARLQIKQYPGLAKAHESSVKMVADSVRRWRKRHPASNKHSVDEWFALGAKSSRPPIPELLRNASCYAIMPEKALGECIREQMLYCIGSRKAQGTWRDLGIHEGQRMLEFIKAYDLVSESGILSGEERGIIKDEICRAGYFFEAWLLDNPATRFERGDLYCLNINIYPAAVLGIIAIGFPEHPESGRWLGVVREQIVKYLLTDFALDGGYGEGSAHYFQPIMEAILEFMAACKNTGTYDYSKDPAVSAAVIRALKWRMDLMAPDGRNAAIGDAGRHWHGGREFELAARLFNKPDLSWASRRMLALSQDFPSTDSANALPDPLVADFSSEPSGPAHLYASYPWSGYAFFRSGWGATDNYFMFKYGPTWIGRRETETRAVIAGHAHEDALQIELHWKGTPLLVDPGVSGAYADYLNYGGYWKATIAHNTVGLGNPHGHDRLDGLYETHVREHGADFRYEQEQRVIGRSDYTIQAMGDAGGACIAAVSAKTLPDVVHTRSILWLRDNSLALVFDRLDSDKTQPYEWYLNPIGRLLEKDGSFVFGDGQARLKVIPLLPEGTDTRVIQRGDPKVPPYYPPLRTDGKTGSSRWSNTSLLIESIKSRKADLINILIPHGEKCPYVETKLGAKGCILSSASAGDSIIIGAAGNDDRTLSVDEGVGFVRLTGEKASTYAVFHGRELSLRGQALVSSKLKSTEWASRYAFALDALISLPDRRASFGLPPSPMEQGLVLERIVSSKRPGIAPVEVDVSFKVNEKPKRVILRKSLIDMPSVNGPVTIPAAAGKVSKTILNFLRDSEPPFSYNESTNMLTVTIPSGVSQLAWE
jgi:hypothetical protein